MAASLRYKTIRSLIVDYRLRATAPRTQCVLNRQNVTNGNGSTEDAQNGNDFKTFGFGGYDLTEGKTLAQSLVDGANKERATVRGLYATCVALAALADNFGWILSSKVSAILVDEDVTRAADEYERAAEDLASERKTLARLTRNCERIHTANRLGGRSEESEKRLTALAVAIREAQQSVATAKTYADNARANLIAAEYTAWKAQRPRKDNNDTDNGNSTRDNK